MSGSRPGRRLPASAAVARAARRLGSVAHAARRLGSVARAGRRLGSVASAARRLAGLALVPLPAALLALAAAAAPLRAQGPGLALRFDEDGAAPGLLERAPLHTAGRYVIIRLAVNRLYVFQGERLLWQAPVGTGTGFRLDGRGHSWHFSTPRGIFRVQAREKDPVWIRPDWSYVEDHQPVPPIDSPLRRVPGTLGTTAMYIGYELAMHGTDHPGLVLRPDPATRRVSHGCIRLTNEDARELYYLVDIGTPVLIY